MSKDTGRKPDFSGYATRYNVKCTDNRVITNEAFKHMEGEKVPFVFNHLYDSPTNVCGHAILSHREGDGLYCDVYLNETDNGKIIKAQVKHGDLTNLSIHARQVKQRGNDVIHGNIREVSIVLFGANKGATIDNIYDMESDVKHSDNGMEYTDEFLLTHNEAVSEEGMPAKAKTIGEVLATLNEEQEAAVAYVVGQALEHGGAAEEGEEEPKEGEDKDNKEVKHSDTAEGGDISMATIFDNNGKQKDSEVTITHGDLNEILRSAKDGNVSSFAKAFKHTADEKGITDKSLELLFPDFKDVNNGVQEYEGHVEWVGKVLSKVHKVPFSKLRIMHSDLTAESLRAKGYVKGTEKTDLIVEVAKREIGPGTVYAKTSMHRDDLIDLADFNAVAWLKRIINQKLDEEIARAILIGDGRNAEDVHKIKETNILPIYKDRALDLLTTTLVIEHEVPADSAPTVAANRARGKVSCDVEMVMDAIVEASIDLEGSGRPAFYCQQGFITQMLLKRDKVGHRIYKTKADICSYLGVEDLIPVTPMKGVHDVRGSIDYGLIGIIVDLRDYTLGANRLGKTTMFDDFDIDFNTYKYLGERRQSGMLTSLKSAIIVEEKVMPKAGAEEAK